MAMKDRFLRHAFQSTRRAIASAAQWLTAQFGPQEVTLWLGLVLLFYGLSRETLTGACVVCGALLVLQAWPRRPVSPGGPSTSRSDVAPAARARG